MAERKVRQRIVDVWHKHVYTEATPVKTEEVGDLVVTTYRRGKSELVIRDLRTQKPLTVKRRIFGRHFRITSEEERTDKDAIVSMDVTGPRVSATVDVPVYVATVTDRTEMRLRRSLLQNGNVGFASALTVDDPTEIPFIRAYDSAGVYLTGPVKEAVIGMNALLKATDVGKLEIGSENDRFGAKARLTGRVQHLILSGNTDVTAYSVGIVSGNSIGNDSIGTKTGKVDSQEAYVSPTPLNLYDKDIAEPTPPFTIPEVNE